MKRISNVALSVIAVLILSVAFVINLYAQPLVKAGKGEATGRQKASSGDFRFNPQNIVVSEFKGGWAIIESTNPKRAIAAFPESRKSDAEKALKIMRHYGMNEKHFVGTSGLVFFLASGKAPEDPSPFPGEKCQPFDPRNVTVEEKTITAKKNPNEVAGTYWALMAGKKQLWAFGNDKGMASMAKQVFIKQYGFTNRCNVGVLTYWRK
ncbi:MAG: hypothetical protein ACXWL9_07490 [Syntrophales bacterium]